MSGGRRLARKNTPGLYKSAARRTDWKQKPAKGAKLTARGTNRQVVVVKSPDPRVFEEAIFVLKEDYVRSRSAEQVMEEARRAADEYLRRHGAPAARPGRGRRTALFGAAGVLAAGIAWLVLRFTGIYP